MADVHIRCHKYLSRFLPLFEKKQLSTMAVLKRGHQASTHSAKSNTNAKGLGRHRHKLNCCVGNGKFSLETIFIFLAFLLAGSFLFIHHIVDNNANKIDMTSSGEKLKRDFLRSTGKSPGINDADADFTNDGNPRADLTTPIAADNEFSPETRREHEQLKRDFLQSTGRQEDNLAMTIITKSDTGTTCSCDIVSADCLDSVNCLPEQATSLRNVATGILLRRLIKKTAKFEGPSLVKDSRCPVGKGFQYKTINAWLSWVNNNELPLQHDPSPTHIFFKNAKHKYCADNSLVSFQCYFTSINEQEEFDTLEAEALPYLDDLLKTNQVSEQKIIRQMQDIQAAVSKEKGNEINALDHLRMMAHILRMLFNRQVPLRELSSMTRSFNANENEESQKQLVSPPLRVSIHIRRADACMANGKLVKEASPLDSSAQQFALRICYATSVYMDALQRLKDIHTKRDPTRRIEVFVSSDDASSLMDEIRDQFSDLYKSMTWRIHDVDRERFNYKGFVEGYDHKNHNLLGEAAAADLWLLSNGEVFIGHLGSRFGKVAYLLATARHNRFIPFFSVDGHSVCCEIDEPCGEMKPYITSMSDCLTFSHDLVQGRGHVLNKDYFEVGSYMRKIVAQALPENESLNVETPGEEREGEESETIHNTVAADNTDSTNNDILGLI